MSVSPSAESSGHSVTVLPPEGPEWVVPELSPSDLAARFEKIKPVTRDSEDNIRLIGPHDPENGAFTFVEERGEAIDGLKEVARITTYHSVGGFHGFFKPTVAEVLAQIPQRFIEQGVCAFETTVAPHSHYGEVTSPEADVHRGVTILYAPGTTGITYRAVDDGALALKVHEEELKAAKRFVPPTIAYLEEESLAELFYAVQKVIFADSHERRAYHNETELFGSKTWDDNGSIFLIIGYRDTLPVNVCFSFDKVGDENVVFIEGISAVKDKAMIERWLATNFNSGNSVGYDTFIDINSLTPNFFAGVDTQPKEASTIATSGNGLPEDIKQRFDNTFFVVEASHFSRASLRDQVIAIGDMTWDEESSPMQVEIGKFDGEEVVVEFNWVAINGKQVAFWHPVSNLFNSVLFDEWLDTHCNPKTSDDRLARVDAMNFHNCLSEI